jgi:hypothetical protein
VTPVAGTAGRGGSSGGLGQAFDGAVAAASNPLFAWLLTTTGGILFFLFLLRRGTRFDDDRPGELVFARAVAAPLAGLPTASGASSPLADGGGPPVIPVAALPPTRTRKAASKKGAPSAVTTGATTRDVAPAAAKAKRGRRSTKTAAKSVERAKISYRRVRVSSEPDDVHSVELARLDRGDEVEILDSHEGFLRIRTPEGVTGWIHRHTVVG